MTRAPWPRSDSARALAHVAVAEHDRDLAAHQDVGGAVDAVDQRVPGAVLVVELALGHRVVDVDGREQQLAGLGELVEPVHTGGGLLGDALDALAHPRVLRRVGRDRGAQQVEDDAVLLGVVLGRCSGPRRSSRTRCPCGSAGWRRRRRRAACSGPCRPARPASARCTTSTPAGSRPSRRRPACRPARRRCPRARPRRRPRRGPGWRRCCRRPSGRRHRARRGSRSVRRSARSCAASRRSGRRPAAGSAPNSSRRAIRPGISCWASRISLRPYSARDRSATL